MKYNKKGQFAGAAVTSVVVLVSGMAVVTLLLIFTGVLGGQVYSQVEADIDNIDNTTISNMIKASIVSGFEANEETAQYLPLISLAFIIGLVMTIIFGIIALPMGIGGGRGGSL